MPNQTIKNSQKAKKIKLLQMNFVLEKQLIKFLCTYQPLSICKIFIKKILELIQSYEDVCHFWDQNSPFVLNKIFLGINHCYYFHLLMALFILQNLKEVLKWIQIMTMHRFWAQSGLFTPNKSFFRKAVNEPCFFYSCLSACQKSKSDINLLVKY